MDAKFYAIKDEVRILGFDDGPFRRGDKETLIRIIAHHTGQDPDKIRRETERDRYFTAQEAKEWGLVDEVLEHPAEPK